MKISTLVGFFIPLLTQVCGYRASTTMSKPSCALCGCEIRGESRPCPMELPPQCAVVAREREAPGDPEKPELALIVSNLERPTTVDALCGVLPLLSPRARPEHALTAHACTVCADWLSGLGVTHVAVQAALVRPDSVRLVFTSVRKVAHARAK